jgi:hypothetical protein
MFIKRSCGNRKLGRKIRSQLQGVERIAVRYSFKRSEFMRYVLMADGSEKKSGYELVFFQMFVVFCNFLKNSTVHADQNL